MSGNKFNSERESGFKLELNVKIEVSEGNISMQSDLSRMETLSGKELPADDFPFALIGDPRRRFTYLRKHLITAVESLAEQMLVQEYAASMSLPEDREKILKEVTARQDKQLRKRTNTGRGRKKAINSPIEKIMTEEERFARQCREIAQKLRLVGIEITKTSLAHELFPNNTNPLQSLRRKLNNFGFSFQELIDWIDGKIGILAFHIENEETQSGASLNRPKRLVNRIMKR